MTLERQSIHGHPVAYRTAGRGPVLVLLHGMAGSSATWLRVMPALARRFTVVAPDLLGHGASAKSAGEYSISGHANVVRDLLAALGHERATLVGQSFGGGVAMQFAYQFPARCERLVLVSSGGLGPEVGLLLRGLSLPGTEHVLPLVCSPALRDAGSRVAGWLAGAGLRVARARVCRGGPAAEDGDRQGDEPRQHRLLVHGDPAHHLAGHDLELVRLLQLLAVELLRQSLPPSGRRSCPTSPLESIIE